ncbi:MAG: DNA polymerase III subunit gamma/tau [bacterium]|nr:DNA polymerase III subunit gamma/tau [bacterium]
MYQALYRKYRPTDFNNVAGQKVVIKTLENSIKNNKISHAYLFTGPRGTGKTSIAKILAKIVNCESLNGLEPCNKCVSCTQTNLKQNVDIIEIDAASNNGVDEIRELREKVTLVPTFGKYKVYIIDEVHMLSTAAFNALLKTLEEPPKHIIFILATTEPHKIPMTILSRCQRFDFKKISINDIIKRLEYICGQENIKITLKALNLIATLSDGGLRDSINLLDQLTSYTNEEITENDVNEVYGTITQDEVLLLLKNIYSNNLLDIFKLIEKYDNDGKNLVKIMDEIINFLKNTLIFFNDSTYFSSKEDSKRHNELLEYVDDEKIYLTIDLLLDSLKSFKTAADSKLLFELSIIKLLKNLNPTQNKETIIPVYEEPKKIISDKTYKNVLLSNDVKEKLKELKYVRINNTLANFDKQDLMNFKKKIDDIKELLMDPEYSSNVSLILDGELKAKGNDYLIFIYKLDNLADCFNQNLINIEKIFKQVFKIDLKPIAISEEEWNPIKTEFNQNLKLNKKSYIYKEETIKLNEIFGLEQKNTQNSNSIENDFSDIIVYS